MHPSYFIGRSCLVATHGEGQFLSYLWYMRLLLGSLPPSSPSTDLGFYCRDLCHQFLTSAHLFLYPSALWPAGPSLTLVPLALSLTRGVFSKQVGAMDLHCGLEEDMLTEQRDIPLLYYLPGQGEDLLVVAKRILRAVNVASGYCCGVSTSLPGTLIAELASPTVL